MKGSGTASGDFFLALYVFMVVGLSIGWFIRVFIKNEFKKFEFLKKVITR